MYLNKVPLKYYQEQYCYQVLILVTDQYYISLEYCKAQDNQQYDPGSFLKMTVKCKISGLKVQSMQCIISAK